MAGFLFYIYIHCSTIGVTDFKTGLHLYAGPFLLPKNNFGYADMRIYICFMSEKKTKKAPRKNRLYKISDEAYLKAIERAKTEDVFVANVAEKAVTEFGMGRRVISVRWTDDKLWERIVKDFAHLDDNNYAARKLYDYITK